jgi:hypothetical protein
MDIGIKNGNEEETSSSLLHVVSQYSLQGVKLDESWLHEAQNPEAVMVSRLQGCIV